MALESKNQTLASDFISLKARVKAEMQRRKYNGDLTKYAGAEWDYVVQPTAGGKLLPEHYNKIIEPLNAIAPTGFNAPIRQGDHAIAIKVAVDKLEEYEKKSPSSGANDCAVIVMVDVKVIAIRLVLEHAKPVVVEDVREHAKVVAAMAAVSIATCPAATVAAWAAVIVVAGVQAAEPLILAPEPKQ